MFKKVKDWLGIEGVKLEVSSVEVDSDHKVIKGEILLSSQTEQTVEGIKIIVKEKYSRGRRKKSKLVDEYTLAEKMIGVNLVVSIDQPQLVEFDIKYDLLKSDMDRLADKNIFYKGVSAIAKLAKNAQSHYFLLAEAKVKGNRLSPFDKIEIDID